MHFDWSVASQ
uniref:Uncharacterized protein n=1 Tax=Anguilla anguilla TaxID=7936 RepID=A0A0E9THD0_ANGAN